MFTFDLGQGATLRLFEPSDTEPLHRVIETEREMLAEWMPWAAGQTLEDTREFLRASRRRFGEADGLDAAILVEDAIAGIISVGRVDWANRSASLGYWLARHAQGRGVVTRAAAALLDHAFGTWDLHRVEIRAGVANARSRAVPERLGFTKEGVRRGAELVGERWIDHIVYAMLADEWPECRRAVAGPT